MDICATGEAANRPTRKRHEVTPFDKVKKKLVTLLDLCVSSLRRGHANLLCIVPILTDGNPEGNPHVSMHNKHTREATTMSLEYHSAPRHPTPNSRL